MEVSFSKATAWFVISCLSSWSALLVPVIIKGAAIEAIVERGVSDVVIKGGAAIVHVVVHRVGAKHVPVYIRRIVHHRQAISRFETRLVVIGLRGVVVEHPL